MNISIDSIINIIIMLIILTILVVVHEWGHIRATRKHGGYVPEFAVGFFPGSKSLIKWVSPKTKTTYHLKPWLLGGYIVPADEDYTGDMYGKKYFKEFSYWQKLHVLLNGVLYNFYFAFLILVPFFMYSGVSTINQVKINNVTQNSPAQTAGLQKNDVILKVDGQTLTSEQIMQILNGEATLVNSSNNVQLTISRNDQILDVTVKPKNENERYIIGVSLAPNDMTTSHTFMSATNQFFNLIQRNIAGLFKLFTFQTKGSEVQSIVGATATIGEVSKQINTLNEKLQFYLTIMGSISVSLMVFNLLPIPALDGGQILIITYEKIRKRELNTKLKNKILTYSFVGLMVLGIGLMLRDTISIIIKNLFGG